MIKTEGQESGKSESGFGVQSGHRAERRNTGHDTMVSAAGMAVVHTDPFPVEIRMFEAV